jgi:hypothetical protein
MTPPRTFRAFKTQEKTMLKTAILAILALNGPTLAQADCGILTRERRALDKLDEIRGNR